MWQGSILPLQIQVREASHREIQSENRFPDLGFFESTFPATLVPPAQNDTLPHTVDTQGPALVYPGMPAGSQIASYPIIYSPYPAIFPPSHAWPPRQMVDQGTQTNNDDLDSRSQLALNFASNIFDGILPGTTVGGRQRRHFQWPKGVVIGPEDRLLVVIRAIKKTGFPTLGAFFAEAFRNDITYNKHPTVYQTISSFLRAKDHSTETHPIAIVDLIFRHRKSQEFIGGVPAKPDFTLPRYALPPSARANPILTIHSPNTTHNAMINWALHRMIDRFDIETKELLQLHHGFLHHPKDPALTWEALLRWSLSQSQETIALHAPVIFALFTSIAVNHSARKKLEAEVAAARELAEESAVVDDGLPFADQAEYPTVAPSVSVPDLDEGDGEDDLEEEAEPSKEKMFIDPIGRRDPWQVVFKSCSTTSALV